MFSLALLSLLLLLGHHDASTASLQVEPEHRCSGVQSVSDREDGSGLFLEPAANPGDKNCSQSLASLLNSVSSDTTVRLEPGDYVIQEFVLLQDLTNITLETNETGRLAHIRCRQDGGPRQSRSAGLAFINVSQLSIRDVVIDGCGFTGEDITSIVSILREIMNFFYNIPTSVRISTLFAHCENVVVERVTVNNTRGFGMVGVNIIGQSELQNIQFINNTNPRPCDPSRDIFSPLPEQIRQYDTLGGAAVFMYFDYLPESNVYREDTVNFKIKNCNFTLNSECSLTYLNLLRSPGRGESRLARSMGYTLGGSGALAIVMAQLDYGVNVETVSSSFNRNSASFGSGSTVALFTGVRNTQVVFDGCKFDESAMVFFNDVRRPMAMSRSDIYQRNVAFSVLNSNFTNITELNTGSTLLIYSNYYTSVVNNSINVYIDKCMFLHNKATVGSAVAIYEYKINGFSEGMQISIRDTHFIENEVIIGERENLAVAISPSASTVNARNVNLTLHGNCSFVDNIGTGLHMESSLVGVDGNVTFLRNVGTNGGAMSLVSYSYLILNRNSSMYFIENHARSGGGAIYVNENGFGSYLIGGYVDCFLHFTYDNFIVCENCSDLDSYGLFVKFSGNTAGYTGSLISGSSLVTCPWAHQLKLNDGFNRTVFAILTDDYPNVFHINQSQTGSDFYQSMSARLVVDDYNTDSSIQVFPGQSFELNVSALDDFNQTITNIVTAYATIDSSDEYRGNLPIPRLSTANFAVLERNRPTEVPVKILAPEEQNVSLIIYSTDSAGRAQKQLSITLLSCGFGFTFNPSNNSCSCDRNLISSNNGVSCDSELHLITVQNGAWIGPFRNETVIDQCLYSYCKPGTRVIYISSDNMSDIDFNVQCDEQTNRVGFLCSKCASGYSSVFGTRNCRICPNWYLFMLVFFLGIGIAAVFVIHYFNMSVTGGFINGVIFYSNIVTLFGYSLVPGDTYNEAIALISFPSLSLGFELCFFNGMSELVKVIFQMIFPVYLFFLMFIIGSITKTRLFKLKEAVGSCIIKTFATLLLLCYVSVLGSCAELIAFNNIRTINQMYYVRWRGDPHIAYFGKEHAVPGLFAAIVTLLYVIPLPLILLCPKLLYSFRYSSKFKPIFDAFWDPFKPRYRFFLGLRLMFRWIPFFLVAVVRPPISIFVTNFFLILLIVIQCTLQPYKDKWQNYVDSAFLCNLALLLTGSVFFWAEFNSTRSNDNISRQIITRRSFIYTDLLIVIGFLFMMAVIIYHICVRFPQFERHLKLMLLNLYRCLKSDDRSNSEEEGDNTVVPPEAESKLVEPNVTILDVDGQVLGTTVAPRTGQRLLTPLRASELREPLLESGTVSLSAVDVALVPSRVQTFLGDLRRTTNS